MLFASAFTPLELCSAASVTISQLGTESTSKYGQLVETTNQVLHVSVALMCLHHMVKLGDYLIKNQSVIGIRVSVLEDSKAYSGTKPPL